MFKATEAEIFARLQGQGCTYTFRMIVPAEKLHFYRLCGTSMYSKVLGQISQIECS
jgi:hypothetical protein